MQKVRLNLTICIILIGFIALAFALEKNFASQSTSRGTSSTNEMNFYTERYDTAFAYFTQGKIQEAIGQYEQALKLDTFFIGFIAAIDTLIDYKTDLKEKELALGVLYGLSGSKFFGKAHLLMYLSLKPNKQWVKLAKSYTKLFDVPMNERAKKCVLIFEKYARAVRKNKEQESRSYWNAAAQERFRLVDWQLMNPERALKIFSYLRPIITNVSDEKQYLKLAVQMKFGNKLIRELSYYFVEENGRMVFANPAELFTKDWLTKETKYFIYLYPKMENPPQQSEFNQIDSVAAELFTLFDTKLERKIYYYKCSDREKVGNIAMRTPVPGCYHPYNRIIVSEWWFHTLEVAHVIGATLGRTIPFMYEGTTYYFKTTHPSRDVLIDWGKTQLETGEALPLDTLIEPKKYWRLFGNDVIAEATSFMKFLIDKYDWVKYRKLWVASSTAEGFRKAVKELYGQDIGKIEKEWKDYILNLEIPRIEPGTNEKAEQIFCMKDPVGDDKGDGDYTYPLNSKFKPGMFDLTEFQIFKDNVRSYFVIKFRDLINADKKSEFGFSGTYVLIFLDTGWEIGYYGEYPFVDIWSKTGVNWEVAGNYDYVIVISGSGIMIWSNKKGFVTILKRRIEDKRIGDSETNTIRFSVPFEFIGKPTKDWKLAVAIGGQWKTRREFGHGTGDLIRVEKAATDSTGGGGTDTKFNPNIYDILAPGGMDQIKILSSYNVKAEKLVVLPMLGIKNEGNN